MLNRLLLSSLLLFAPVLLAEPLYWSASKDSTQLIIVGSLHVGSDQFYPLPDELEQHLKQSAGLVIEADVLSQSNTSLPPNQISSEQVLTDKQRLTLDKIARQLQLDAQQILQLPPWSASLVLQMRQLAQSGYQAERGVDLYFMQQAKRQHMPILSLESVQFQIDLLANLPNSGQELLVSLIEQWQNNAQFTQCLIESWRKGDQHNLLQSLKASDMSAELQAKMLTNRNQDWAAKLSSSEFLTPHPQPYLVVVGALHLIGEQSLLTYLKQQGFSITQLSRSQTANCSF